MSRSVHTGLEEPRGRPPSGDTATAQGPAAAGQGALDKQERAGGVLTPRGGAAHRNWALVGASGGPSASKPTVRSPRHLPPSTGQPSRSSPVAKPSTLSKAGNLQQNHSPGAGGQIPKRKGDSGRPQQSQTATVASRALGTKPELLNLPSGPMLLAHRLSVSAIRENFQF